MKHYCTLFDLNYLTRGLALHSSLVKNCDDFKLWILCMDSSTYKILQKMALPNVSLIKLADFEDKQLLATKKTRSHGEYCWTCTPSLPLYILKNNPSLLAITYLDSDLYFYSSPDPIFEEMGADSILIIPHRIVPWKKQKEIDNGLYNVGMMIFRNDANGLKCLQWWRKKCLEWCYYRVEKDRMGDQKYLDEFPKLFNKVHILKHLGGGVAPWNIGQYKITKINGRVYIDNFPLIFYHFGDLEIYPKSFIFSPVSRGPYWDKASIQKLIYQPYFDEIYYQAKLANISAGFSKRPSFANLLFETAIYWKEKICA